MSKVLPDRIEEISLHCRKLTEQLRQGEEFKPEAFETFLKEFEQDLAQASDFGDLMEKLGEFKTSLMTLISEVEQNRDNLQKEILSIPQQNRGFETYTRTQYAPSGKR